MNHFQTGSVQNVTLVSIEILQLEFKINQTCAGHSRGSLPEISDQFIAEILRLNFKQIQCHI